MSKWVKFNTSRWDYLGAKADYKTTQLLRLVLESVQAQGIKITKKEAEYLWDCHIAEIRNGILLDAKYQRLKNFGSWRVRRKKMPNSTRFHPKLTFKMSKGMKIRLNPPS